jgi:pre-mRNA-splicing factor SYF1
MRRIMENNACTCICVVFLEVWSLQIINTYTEAVQTVDPKLASGKPNTLWVEFAKFYEKAGQIEDVSFSSFL